MNWIVNILDTLLDLGSIEIDGWVRVLLVVFGLPVFKWYDEMETTSVANQWPKKFESWNTRSSWRNKWKSTAFEPVSRWEHWWYLGLYKPKRREKFAFSSTLLVWTTDPEHWFQFIKHIGLVLVITGMAGYAGAFVAAWIVIAALSFLSDEGVKKFAELLDR